MLAFTLNVADVLQIKMLTVWSWTQYLKGLKFHFLRLEIEKKWLIHAPHITGGAKRFVVQHFWSCTENTQSDLQCNKLTVNDI